MARGTVRARWWMLLLVLMLSALMVSLGAWQLQRAAAKQELLDHYARAAALPPQALDTQAPAAPEPLSRVHVTGRYASARQLLLDNQGLNGRPGYRVWTPLRDTRGILVLVDRGWIPREQGLAHAGLDLVDETRELTGYWQALPRPGLRLQADNCAPAPWPRVVQYPTLDDLACVYGEPVAPGLLLLDATVADGFARNWAGAPELNPAKHYGYAAQWFAFTLTLIAIFLKLGLRRRP